MLNLPSTSLKEFEVDATDPFVARALRPHRRNEPCWCGSGKKYKKCHQIREDERPYTLGQALNRQHKVFWKRRGCMHPGASPDVCRGSVIDSHSIQRKGALSKIVDEKNHVCHLDRENDHRDIEVRSVGWRKASVFPGFCAHHDSSLFSELEDSVFDGSHEKNVLQAFRNVCNELYRKRALIEAFQDQRSILDRGRSINDQISLQLSIAKTIEGSTKSAEELSSYWSIFQRAIQEDRFDLFSSRVYFFEGEMSVISSSALQVEYDFAGNPLADMWDLGVDTHMLSHAVMATDTGGAITFCWPTASEDAERVVDSFEALSDYDKPDVFVQYCFLNAENTYFSLRWWEQLTAGQRSSLKRLAPLTYYDGGAYVANDVKLVDWTLVS